ncbi:MAG: leucine-rich repeat domain-containing protein [Lachnospiraceae bacterium]|nr:leucine-rich repeat domain-containing protein [Lachnospiraceae bacterium]
MRKVIKKVVASALSAALVLGLGAAYTAAPAKKASAATKYKSYRAYISYQTSAYAFRDLWDDGVGAKTDPAYGIEQSIFQVKPVGNGADQYVSYSPLLHIATHSIGKYVSSEGNYSAELKNMAWQGGPYKANYTECEITGPGTYSVKMELPDTWELDAPTLKKELATNLGNNLFTDVENKNTNKFTDQSTGKETKAGNIFRFVFASTDIPRALFDDGSIKFDNIKLLVDGVEVNSVDNASAGAKGNGGVKDDETDYCVITPLNYYDSTSNNSSVCKKMTFDAPKKSLEVQFTVSGDFINASGSNAPSQKKFVQGLSVAQGINSDYVATVTQAQNTDGTFKTLYEYANQYSELVSCDTKEEAQKGAKASAEEKAAAAAAVTCAGVATGKTFTAASAGYSSLKAKVLKSARTDGTAGTVAIAGTTSKNITSFDCPSVIYYNGFVYNVTQINSAAFKNCKKLSEVELGSKITTIAANAFYGCKKLQYLKLNRVPSTVKKNAFKGCKKKIYVSGKSPKNAVKKLKNGSKYKKFAVDPGQEKVVNKLYD